MVIVMTASVTGGSGGFSAPKFIYDCLLLIVYCEVLFDNSNLKAKNIFVFVIFSFFGPLECQKLIILSSYLCISEREVDIWIVLCCWLTSL